MAIRKIDNALLAQLETDANGMPLNAIRNNSTGNMLQIMSESAPQGPSLDYSRPMIQLADGRKGYYGKNDPMNVYDANGQKMTTLIPDVEAHNMAQDRAYQLQKRQMDLETERLQQEGMRQQLSGGKRPPAPAGYMWNEQGNGMIPIPGGPADMKAQGKFNQDLASMQGTESAMNSLAEQANTLLKHKGLDAATGWQSIFPSIPGGKAKDFEAMLDTLRSKTAFGTLQAMRDASKTGGALGAVSEKELKLLESNLAALDKAQSPDQFKKQLAEIVKYAEGAKSRTRDAFNVIHSAGQASPSAAPGGAQIISEARNAIMKGASRAAVVQRLESMGITNHGL